MTITDYGTGVIHDYIPLAFANGVEWSYLRRGRVDRFNCLYRRGFMNKLLWYMGAYWVCLSNNISMFEK